MTWQRRVYVATVIAIIVVFALLLRHVNTARLWRAMVGVRWSWIAIVVVLNVLNTWIEAVRWRLILRTVKRNLRIASTFAAMLVGILGNSVLPLRLGDGARAYFLARRERVPAASSLASVMLDRVMDVTFFLALVVVTGLFFHFPSVVRRGGLLGGIALGVAVIVLLILVKFGPRLLGRFDGKLGRKLGDQVHRFTVGLSALKCAGVLFPAGALSSFSWVLRLVMVMSIFQAFHFSLPVTASEVVLIFANLGIAAVSTPANVGGFELSVLAGLKLFSIDTETALSCALVFHVVEVVPMVILGMIALWSSGIKSGELFSRLKSQ